MQGWLKLNTDGCNSGVSSRAGGGGLLRDCDGNLVGWFLSLPKDMFCGGG